MVLVLFKTPDINIGIPFLKAFHHPIHEMLHKFILQKLDFYLFDNKFSAIVNGDFPTSRPTVMRV